MTNPLQIMQLDFSSGDIPWSHGQSLFKLWDKLRGDMPWPSRNQLDPMKMHPYLQHIMLMDVQADHSDFTVRLVGTGYSRFMPYDPTGDSISSFTEGDATLSRLQLMLKIQKPYMILDQEIPWADKMYQYKKFDGLVLPLGEKDCINILMLLVHYK